MKTLTILLFSAAVSLTACATDDSRERGALDKDSDADATWIEIEDPEGVAQLIPHDLGLEIEDPEAVRQLIPRDPRLEIEDPHSVGQLIQHRDPRLEIQDPEQVSEWLDQLSAGARSIDQLDFKVVQAVEQIVPDGRGMQVEDKTRVQVQAEDLVVDGHGYTLIHGPRGSHYVVDELGNAYVINR